MSIALRHGLYGLGQSTVIGTAVLAEQTPAVCSNGCTPELAGRYAEGPRPPAGGPLAEAAGQPYRSALGSTAEFGFDPIGATGLGARSPLALWANGLTRQVERDRRCSPAGGGPIPKGAPARRWRDATRAGLAVPQELFGPVGPGRPESSIGHHFWGLSNSTRNVISAWPSGLKSHIGRQVVNRRAVLGKTDRPGRPK